MLTNTRVRCQYCKQFAFFRVFTWRGRVYASIYTECAKCDKYVDCYYFRLEEYDKYLEDVLATREIPSKNEEA